MDILFYEYIEEDKEELYLNYIKNIKENNNLNFLKEKLFKLLLKKKKEKNNKFILKKNNIIYKFNYPTLNFYDSIKYLIKNKTAIKLKFEDKQKILNTKRLQKDNFFFKEKIIEKNLN